MKVLFICPASVIVASFTTPQRNITISKYKVPYPARIKSISRRGSVEIRFFLSVITPNFTRSVNHSTDSSQRQLNVTVTEPNADYFIEKDVLKVQLQTKSSRTDLDW
jgi:hypothetical protein